MISQPCTPDTKELLYLDLQSSRMYRCSGDHWQPWNWGSGGKSHAMLKDSSAEPERGEILKMENFFVPSLREDAQRLSCALGVLNFVVFVDAYVAIRMNLSGSYLLLLLVSFYTALYTLLYISIPHF